MRALARLLSALALLLLSTTLTLLLVPTLLPPCRAAAVRRPLAARVAAGREARTGGNHSSGHPHRHATVAGHAPLYGGPTAAGAHRQRAEEAVPRPVVKYIL